MTQPKIEGRFWAYSSVVLGGSVSVAANVAHSFIAPHNAPTEWRPEIGAVIGAVVWPVVLFFAIELLVRIPWPRGWSWSLLARAGILPVAAVAAFVSYRHLSGLLAHYGEEPIVCFLGPIAVDGLMIMATGALMVIHHRRNLANAPAPTPVPVPAAAPIAPALPIPVPVPVPVVAAPAPAPRKAPAKKATPAPVKAPAVKAPAKKAATRKATPALTATDPGPVLGEPSAVPVREEHVPDSAPAVAAPSTNDTPVTALDAARTLAAPITGARLSRAEHIAHAHRNETGTPITAGQLAVRMQVGTDIAAQLLGVLALRPDNPTTPIPTVNGAPVKAAR